MNGQPDSVLGHCTRKKKLKQYRTDSFTFRERHILLVNLCILTIVTKAGTLKLRHSIYAGL